MLRAALIGQPPDQQFRNGASSLASIVTTDVAALVMSLHRQLDEDREHERLWRHLEAVTDLSAGMSYLLLGLSLPMVTDAIRRFVEDINAEAIVAAALAGFMVYFGTRLLQASAAVKSHFVNDGANLRGFLESLQADNPSRALSTWLARPGLTQLRKPVKDVLRAVKLGFAALLGLGLAYLTAYVSLMAAIVATQWGFAWGIAVALLLLLGSFAFVWWVWASPKRGPRLPAGFTNVAEATPTTIATVAEAEPPSLPPAT